LFEVADRGTLFLDEIGELPMTAQAKLLRAIETGEIQRVGGLDMRRVDVRVIAATNRDLRAECAAGRFREDLFYRLSVIELNVTPLRDRREDIPYLTSAFVEHFATQFNKPIAGPTPAAERVLAMAQWPGNVRELRNTIERICMLTGDRFFTEKETVACLSPQPALDQTSTFPGRKRDPHLLADAERSHIARVLSATAGNKQAAAKLLGVSRRALYRKLDRLGIR
jgi:DNA-binding NtrC family response regulator